MTAANGGLRSLQLRPGARADGRYYIAEGSHLRLFDKLGAHPIHHEGADGVHFAVWAPNAKRRVSRGRRFQRLGRPPPSAALFAATRASGKSSCPTSGGASYKFEIIGADGTLQPLKADPFAFAFGTAPGDRLDHRRPGAAGP
jgi:1,4-alpha-glucan branching enzyme